MKYVYLTESGVPEDLSLPTVNADSIEHLAFLDLKAFKKLRKKIKAELKSDSQKIVIIYSTPAAVIASGLRSQIEPEQLVTQWTQQAEALVELFKTYQSNFVLANSNALKADISGLRKLVSMNKKERATFDILSKEADADIYTLSAHYMIDNNDSLKRQLVMLDACTAFNEYSEETCDIQTILNQQSEKEKQLEAELSKSQLALEQQQAEVVVLQQSSEGLTKQVAQEKEATIEAEAKHSLDIEKLQNTIKQLAQEKETIVTHLHSLQMNIESEYEKVQSLNDEKDTLNNVLKSTEFNLAKQTKEKELVVAKLNSLQESFESQSKQIQSLSVEKDKLNEALKNVQRDLTNQKEENELIIEQLHFVQETFEESILDTNRLKTKTLNLEKQIERSESHQVWLVKELLASHEVNAKSWSYRSLMKKKIKTIKESGLFDEAWYLETYPEVAASKINPILHYLLYGAVEGKNPSPEFNTKNYLSIYFDVAQHGMNPFIHYISFGKKEGRKADPLQKRLPSPRAG